MSNAGVMAGVLLAAQLGGLMAQASPLTKSSLSSEWAVALPEEEGMDSAALVEMFDYVRQQEIPVYSVQIVRHAGWCSTRISIRLVRECGTTMPR